MTPSILWVWDNGSMSQGRPEEQWPPRQAIRAHHVLPSHVCYVAEMKVLLPGTLHYLELSRFLPRSPQAPLSSQVSAGPLRAATTTKAAIELQLRLYTICDILNQNFQSSFPQDILLSLVSASSAAMVTTASTRTTTFPAPSYPRNLSP